MLKEISWPSHRRFKSRTQWEPVGFFSDCLCHAYQFDLMLGFFSSSAINVLSCGFASFLHRGGRMRLVINDILTEQDREAIALGLSDVNIPYFNLEDVSELKKTLSEHDEHFFNCLAWLIRHNKLEIQIVSLKDGIGISHTKSGMFSDGVNTVGFDGSCNFSRTALLENIESITASCDWDGDIEKAKITELQMDFDRVFSGEDESVNYIDSSDVQTRILTTFPDKGIVALLEDEKALIHKKIIPGIPGSIENALRRAQNHLDEICFDQVGDEDAIEYGKPRFPFAGGPRKYQVDAFNKWKENKQKGLFAMATGTGKTLTSLNCLLNIYNKFGFYKAIILVPTITLVDQWENECKKFLFRNIIKVCSKNRNWQAELDGIKSKEEFNTTYSEPSYIIIATYASFARENIFRTLVGFNKKATRQILLIADEAHNMGAGRILDRLSGVKFARRIGLSATPERQFDDKGNRSLMDFFGCENNQYTFEYTMQEAIDNGFLCRYYYYPHLVRLTDEEMSEYIKISTQLSRLFYNNKESLPQSDEVSMRLLLKRKRIIHKAQNKIAVFRKILEDRYEENGNLKYTLVYVPEGNHPDDNQADLFDETEFVMNDDFSDHIIDTYTEIVQSISPTTTVRRFVSGIKERDAILSDFASGDLEVLTSMKCLDEGVDVPRSELAIFCASTGNPRQFIQRRGRILRLHPEKHNAVIHDLVVVPEINSASECFNMERSLLSNELKRVRDFAEMSENADYAYSELSEVLSYYDLSFF